MWVFLDAGDCRVIRAREWGVVQRCSLVWVIYPVSRGAVFYGQSDSQVCFARRGPPVRRSRCRRGSSLGGWVLKKRVCVNRHDYHTREVGILAHTPRHLLIIY